MIFLFPFDAYKTTTKLSGFRKQFIIIHGSMRENNIWLLQAVHTQDTSIRCSQTVPGAAHLRRLF